MEEPSQSDYTCVCVSSEVTAGSAVVKPPADNEEVPPQVSMTGASGTNSHPDGG